MVSLRSHLVRAARHAEQPSRPKQQPDTSTGIILLCASALTIGTLHATEPAPDINRWLAQQTNLVTWSADVVQTRKLKSLTQPLVSPGRVWFQAPNLFRWELGSPPRTIAVRQPDQLTLLYPLLRRAEVYPLTDTSEGPWRNSLTLLEAGFPRNRSQLDEQFLILRSETNAASVVVNLQPKAAAARQWVTQVQVTLDSKSLDLVATELSFTDGSSLRNDFTNSIANLSVEPGLLKASIPEDYTVEQPGKP